MNQFVRGLPAPAAVMADLRRESGHLALATKPAALTTGRPASPLVSDYFIVPVGVASAPWVSVIDLTRHRVTRIDNIDEKTILTKATNIDVFAKNRPIRISPSAALSPTLCDMVDLISRTRQQGATTMRRAEADITRR